MEAEIRSIGKLHWNFIRSTLSIVLKVALSQKILDYFYFTLENLNKSFNVLGRKFKFSAQDSDLEYLFWQRKNSPVSSDLKPP